METTWIVLASDCRLRVFEFQGNEKISYEIVDFLSPKGKMYIRKSHEGIQHDSLTRNHSTCADDNNEADQCNGLAQQGNLFSKQISSYIERARQNGCFEKMKIIGSEKFLKLLRQDMSEKAKCLVEKEFIDDAMGFEQPILEKYFK